MDIRLLIDLLAAVFFEQTTRWVWLMACLGGFAGAWVLTRFGKKPYLQACGGMALVFLLALLLYGFEIGVAVVIAIGTSLALFWPIYLSALFHKRVVIFVTALLSSVFAAMVFFWLVLSMTFQGV